MTSSFSWLDHDESERRKMLEVVNLFREKGTLDELGFGTIRDAFADYFFPGTSTIQTRVRYFLFIPWIYGKLERDCVSSAQVDQQARRWQAQLAQALTAGGEGEGTGVIGSQAGERLQRPPSVVYWAGLWRWGIRTFSGSLAQYHLAFDGLASEAPCGLRSDDAEGELVEVSRRNWHGGLPEPPADLFEATSFRLRRQDAEYLQERILTSVPETFLAHLVRGRRIPEKADAPWLYPDLGQLPSDLQGAVEHGRRFSLLASGAQLVYNLLMAERAVEEGMHTNGHLVDRYRERLNGWFEELNTDLDRLRSWDRAAFWAFVRELNPALPPATYRFAETWMTYALENPEAAPDRGEVRALIANRERQLKGGLARLHSRRALERWNGESGTGRLTYRWNEGRRVAVDIVEGLTRGDRVDAGA
jgi:hypothetical protein